MEGQREVTAIGSVSRRRQNGADGVARCRGAMRTDERREQARGPSGAAEVSARVGRSGAALVLMAGVIVLWLAVVALIVRAAALAPDDAGKLFVIFPPGTSDDRAFAAIVGAGGAPIRPALGQWAWIAHDDGPGFVGRLEAGGALAAFRGAPVGLTLAGCFGLATDPEVPHDALARALAARAAVRDR